MKSWSYSNWISTFLQVFDTTASGKIKVDDFRNIMMNLGEKLTEDDVMDMLNYVEYTPKGEIKYRGKGFK